MGPWGLAERFCRFVGAVTAMTAPAPPRDPHEAMAALERLYAKKVVTLEEAQAAAKLLTGDPSTVFPPPKSQPAPAAAAQGEGQGQAQGQGQGPAGTEGSSDGGAPG